MISTYLSGSTPVTLNLADFVSQGVAQRWQLTSSNVTTRLSDLSFSGSSVTTTAPQQSITLFLIPAGNGNLPPAAVAAASPASGMMPLPVSFNGGGSSDSDGSIVSYTWTSATAAHAYTAAGTYTATLTVTDDQGATGIDSVAITVYSDVPNAPSGLSASVSGSTVMLRWTDNALNEDGFYIERAVKTKSPVFGRVGQVGANVAVFQNTGIPRGTYLYRVQAFRRAKTSGYSNQVQARVR